THLMETLWRFTWKIEQKGRTKTQILPGSHGVSTTKRPAFESKSLRHCMKFLKLQVENFMALASAEVELDQRGLVLIQGVNSGDSSAASNGAGKSTLMNSLMWCLYGETAHGVKGDDVLSTGHEKKLSCDGNC
ncbi:AAA family ATPase, partial [Porphyromonas cangingivalis]|uniref:AAA family ATPase n=1 Tax=Porphyromonas cangingivalis TaxID=36874 RepID=UPI001C65BDD9